MSWFVIHSRTGSGRKNAAGNEKDRPASPGRPRALRSPSSQFVDGAARCSSNITTAVKPTNAMMKAIIGPTMSRQRHGAAVLPAAQPAVDVAAVADLGGDHDHRLRGCKIAPLPHD